MPAAARLPGSSSKSNPLSALPPSTHAVLTALHALLPPPMLLQALDLLDRELVTRVVMGEGTEPAGGTGTARAEHSQPTLDASRELRKDTGEPYTGGFSLEAQILREGKGRVTERQQIEVEASTTAPPSTPSVSHNLEARQQPPSLKSPTLGPTSDFEETPPHTKRQAHPQTTLYIVSSAQTPRARLSRTISSGRNEKTYIVRPTAWNCTCAAFTFSAFPYDRGNTTPLSANAGGGGINGGAGADDEEILSSLPRSCADGLDWPGWGDAGHVQARSSREDSYRGASLSGWEFGGLSVDGRESDGSGVPCCKHLLACVLVERWPAVLGGYAKERSVTRGVMARIATEG